MFSGFTRKSAAAPAALPKAAGAPKESLSGLDEAHFRPDSSAPPGILVENLRRRGIDRLRLSISPPPAAGAWSKLLSLGGQGNRVTQTVTIADQKVHLETAATGKAETPSVTVPFSAVRGVELRQGTGAQAHLSLVHAKGTLAVGAGLGSDSLAWLRDRLLLELAGLVWKPVFNVGRRSTRKLSMPEDDSYADWHPGRSNRLIDSFLQEAPDKAAELRKAIYEASWPDVRKTVHWLKSSCASVGAAQLSELCQRMEIEIDINDLTRIRLLGSNFDTEFSRVVATLERIRSMTASAETGPAAEADDAESRETASVLSEEAPGDTGAEYASALKGFKILLAEDSKVNQALACEYLEEAGAEVMVAGDGKTAVEMFESGMFDIIFMDCQMPGVDGFDATRMIRQREVDGLRPQTPIVALTAHALRDDKARCLAAGMNDYLSKPYAQDEIISMAARWVQLDTEESDAHGAEEQSAHMMEADMAAEVEALAADGAEAASGGANAEPGLIVAAE